MRAMYFLESQSVAGLLAERSALTPDAPEVRIVQRLPRVSMGKVSKAELRERP
jgi:hypothetical protein